MNINLSATRAQKARFAWKLRSSSLRKTLYLLMVVLAAGGLMGVLSGYETAYLAFAPAILFFMVTDWFEKELRDLPAERGENLADVLEWSVLARIKNPAPNAYDLWKALVGHGHVNFFALRYGILPEFFDQTLPQAQVDMTAVWNQARQYQITNQLHTLDAACLLVALFKNTSGSQAVMDNLKLDISELEQGLSWVSHLEHIIETSEHTRPGGGVGRDWASGYTPFLNQIGHNISREVERSGLLYRPIKSRQAVISQMLKTLSQTGKSNIALVGETGVGKTTSVYGLADSLLRGEQPDLKYHQIFSLDAATLIANSRQRGDLEKMMFKIINEAIHAKNVILFLDEAQLFLENGTGSVDLSNLLIPLLQTSQARIIFSLTPPQWQRLSSENTALAGLINYQLIPPTDQQETLIVLQDQSLLVESKHGVLASYFALREAYSLADHYLSEEAFPGKAIKLLEQAAVNAGKGTLLTQKHLQQTIESTKGVKVQDAGGGESAKLLNLEAELHKQMVNQESAVASVANALRRARAGTKNPNRPIGAFLFLGPTGVGKTQLAKALADVYFGSAKNIIRVDMNEYVNSADIGRLLAPQGESQTATFLAHIRQQPFSVVLLDEIEKAHPDIINAFLQLLDEGTISDTGGRQASFKDAIIIATSNAGADKIREYISAGRQQADFQQEFIDGIISSGQFRPELINRFDEILVFRPLSEAELMKVLDIMLAEVNQTLQQKRITVSLDEPAKLWLVKKGNAPRLGARPMRRMVQKYVEDAVAKRVLQGSAQPGTQITITQTDLESTNQQ